jgi:hypothetical protein
MERINPGFSSRLVNGIAEETLSIYPKIPPIVIASGFCEAISALAMTGLLRRKERSSQ